MWYLILFSFMTFASDDLIILGPKNKRTKAVHSSANARLEKFMQENQKLTQSLDLYLSKPLVMDFSSSYDLKSGYVQEGVLLNSIVSTNLESPMVVEISSVGKLPVGSTFICSGITKHKRVVSACQRLVIPEHDDEYEVKTSLLNLDGSSGLKADYYYTGKEEFVAGALASSFARGIVELQTERQTTPLGEITKNTTRNRLLNGALSATDEVNSLMKSEMQTKEPKVYIKAGRKVLIYFHERFKI